MTLTEVESTILQVRKRVADFPIENYRYREMETRYVLIDPILKALGWDLANPGECSFEADPKWESWVKPHVDYVLWRPSEMAAAVIEAKRAENDFSDNAATRKAVEQLTRYVDGLMSGRAVLTNGKVWQIYNLRQRREFADTIEAEAKILEGDIREAAQTLHERLHIGNWWPDKRCRRCRYHRDMFRLSRN